MPARRCWLAVCVLLLAFVAAGCADSHHHQQYLYPEDEDESVHEHHSHMMYKDLIVAGFGR